MDTTVEVPREKLRQIIEKNGDGILMDSDRVEGLLRDHCGAHRKEISALVGALEERIPMELRSSWQTAMTPEAMRARLVQRLEDHRGLAPEVANWAVDAWSYALGIGLGRKSDRLDSVILGSGARSGAPGSVVRAPESHAFNGSMDTAEARRLAVESDRPGSVAAASGAGVLATPAGKRNAGIGAIALVALIAGAVALNHRQPTPDPQPQTVVPAPAPAPAPPGPAPVRRTAVTQTAIPIGTPVDIRLNQGISSDEVEPGQTFTATLVTPLTLNGKVIAPTGSDALVKVVNVQAAGKVSGRAEVDLQLIQISAGGKRYTVSTAAHPFLGPQQTIEATKRGAIGGAIGAGVGFLGGKLFHHGGTGAGIGAAGGGTVGVLTTKPKPVVIQPETILHYRLTRPLPAN